MGPKEFGDLSQKYFGSWLTTKGFEIDAIGQRPVYYRYSESEICQLIIPQLGGRGVWFDVLMFVGHKKLLPDFFLDFPNKVYDVTGGRCYLHPETGVGFDQYQYRCRTEEGFVRNFDQHAKPALEKFGIPYLDSLNKIDDLIKIMTPNIRNSCEL